MRGGVCQREVPVASGNAALDSMGVRGRLLRGEGGGERGGGRGEGRGEGGRGGGRGEGGGEGRRYNVCVNSGHKQHSRL